MRLLMLNSTPRDTFGGVEKWMVRSARGLIQRGHTVHVVSRPGSRLEARFAEEGISAHRIGFGSDWNPVSALRIAAIARREDLQIAIVNHNKELTHVALARRCSPLRKVVARSVLPMMDTGRRHRRLYARHLDGMITPSREVKRKLEGYPWLHRMSVQNIPNGIDLSALDRRAGELGGRHLCRRALGLPPDAFVVGSVGRLEPHKGYHHLAAAFGHLSASLPDAHLLLVGDGPEMERLVGMSAGPHGDHSRAMFPGYQVDVYPYLLSMDVLVLPSTTEYETFGQALVEAMACYVPVIGSAVGGIPEVIRDGRNGILVPPGDEAALARALARLAGDPALRRSLSRAGRTTVEERFGEEQMLDKLEEYLQRLLDA